MEEDLSSYLKKYKIVAISGIDTRKLTRVLREVGLRLVVFWLVQWMKKSCLNG